MGFSSLIDILGSGLIGGFLLLILFRINDATIENNYIYGGELIVQLNLTSIVELLEYDFRKIGYCKDWEKIPDPTFAILYADSTRIKFLTDEARPQDGYPDGDGIVDTMEYFVGSPSALSGTPNPNGIRISKILL